MSELIRDPVLMVTGASGLVGQSLVRYLAKKCRGFITIYAAGRDPVRLEHLFNGFPSVRVVAYERALRGKDLPRLDYIVHAASVTSPALYVSASEAVRRVNVEDLSRLLDLARRVDVRRTLFVSSSEVYGLFPASRGERPFEEDKWGLLDESSPRSSYAFAKRAGEELCRQAAASGVDTAVVRPSFVYGTEASDRDPRISSAFLWTAARGEDILLKSAGDDKRMYVNSYDCARGIECVLGCGVRGEVYNIADDANVLTIRQFAEIVADCGGVSVHTVAANASERAAFNPMRYSLLSTSRIQRLGWHPEIPIRSGVEAAIRTMRGQL